MKERVLILPRDVQTRAFQWRISSSWMRPRRREGKTSSRMTVVVPQATPSESSFRRATVSRRTIPRNQGESRFFFQLKFAKESRASFYNYSLLASLWHRKSERGRGGTFAMNSTSREINNGIPISNIARYTKFESFGKPDGQPRRRHSRLDRRYILPLSLSLSSLFLSFPLLFSLSLPLSWSLKPPRDRFSRR